MMDRCLRDENGHWNGNSIKDFASCIFYSDVANLLSRTTVKTGLIAKEILVEAIFCGRRKYKERFIFQFRWLFPYFLFLFLSSVKLLPSAFLKWINISRKRRTVLLSINICNDFVLRLERFNRRNLVRWLYLAVLEEQLLYRIIAHNF